MEPRWIIALALGVIVLASAGLLLLDRPDPDRDRGPEFSGDPAGRAGAPDPDLGLPLQLTDIGFGGGAVRESEAGEGPGSNRWCGQSPDPAGLVQWRGNRLTAADGQRRVAQVVARFTSAADASAYVAANEALITCQRWESTGDGQTARFAVAPAPTGPSPGDETVRFDLEVTGPEPTLHLRVVLVRDGAEVTQFMVVALDPSDLTPLESQALDHLDL